MTAQRVRHETLETSKAVRQLGREWKPSSVGETSSLQEALKQRIRELGSSQKSKASTAGVGRRVRHTGVFVTDSDTPQTGRQYNKEAAQQLAAQVSLQYRYLMWCS